MKAYIRSRRTGIGRFTQNGHPALSCQRDGCLQANRFGKGQLWEEWEVEQVDGGQFVVLQSRHKKGKYLSAKVSGQVRVDGVSIGQCEKWQVENAGADAGYVALKSCFGRYLSCEGFFACGKEVKADKKKAERNQQWILVTSDVALTKPDEDIKQVIAGSLVAAGAVVTAGAVAVPLLGFGAGGCGSRICCCWYSIRRLRWRNNRSFFGAPISRCNVGLGSGGWSWCNSSRGSWSRTKASHQKEIRSPRVRWWCLRRLPFARVVSRGNEVCRRGRVVLLTAHNN